ncbi:hypothetical protein PSP31121_04758 [Pandoraea sputorum]|uniref:Uncharacterized protein n=1 Tax=Pandoraea sputorum TaxID=93222 RepID=A0A5E5BEV4_9BURK|nr:hypothetical protein PSP31121_04758 [Pandoraea sputorum]
MVAAGDDHGLLAQRLNDFGREAFAHARSELDQAVGECLLTGCSKSGRRRVALEQIEHRWMVQTGAEDSLKRGMDLGEQAANAVAGLGNLGGEIVVEAAQHGEFSELLVGQSKGALRMRRRAGGLSDDRGIAGVGLGFAGVQIGATPHGQSGQIGDHHAFVACNSHRQCADGGGLVNDEQDSAVSLEFGDEGAQLGLVVGKRLIVQALAATIERNGVMLAFADVNANEDIGGVMLLNFLHRSLCRVNGLACNNGGKSRHPRYGRRGISRPNPYQRSPATHQAR